MTTGRAELDILDGEDGGAQRSPAIRPLDWAGFVLRSARRRPLLVVSILLCGSAALPCYYFLKRPMYRAETRILAQRQQSLPSIVRPNVGEDQPTRAAWELIHRRDNLLALAKQTNLVDEIVNSPEKTPVGRGLSVLGRGGREDPVEELVILLDKKLKVATGDGTVTIEIDWPDPQQAYRLVEGALQNFLEARHLQEITALDEGISLLQGRSAILREQLTAVVEETRREVAQDARSTRVAVPSTPAVRNPESEEAARLRSLLEAKGRAISDVEEFRRRRLADLQAQYDARRAVYSEAHPEMMTLRQDIDALSRESPQIAALREEERKLRSDYEARRPSAPAPAMSVFRPPAEGVNALVEQNERVRDARFQHQQMLERVNAAQLELDTARAAFKYRYNIIWPTQVPRRPVSPNPLKVFGAGGLSVVLLAFLAAAFFEWRAGRVVERWQIERGLGLPWLGNVTHV